jgi:hypothetical protein
VASLTMPIAFRSDGRRKRPLQPNIVTVPGPVPVASDPEFDAEHALQNHHDGEASEGRTEQR